MRAEIRVFGTLEIVSADRSVAVARGQQERLLGALVLAVGKPVAADTLAVAVRGDHPPRHGEAALYPIVSRLRRALLPIGVTITSGSGSYTLHCPADQIDLYRFDRLLADGRTALRAGAPADAVRLLADAVALARGPLLGDLTGAPFDDERRRSEFQYLTARTELAEARLALGEHRELVGDLELLVAQNPLHEPATALLVLALYRSGRQSHAMSAYHRVRRRLAEELGQPPSPDLAALYEQILAQDSRLDWSSPERRDVWNLPPVDPAFVGREDLLRTLGELLGAGGAVALHGLPGVGKTRLALQYAHGSDSDVVWWCPAESSALVDASLTKLATRLGVAVADDVEGTRLALRRSLARRPGWLLVFDNAEDLDAIGGWLPQLNRGQVLLTSRRADWHRHAMPLAVPVFLRAESVALLRQRTGADGPALDRLAERLGDLPLALEQAGAFCDRTGESVEGYLAFLRGREKDMLALGRSAGDEGTVAATFRIAFDRVAADEPRAVRLLRRAAFLAADGIPLPLLGACLPGIAGDLDLVEVIGALRRYSLVDRHGGLVSVHRLVQSLVRSGLRRAEQEECVRAATAALTSTMPVDPYALEVRPQWDLYVPHLSALLDHAARTGVWPAPLDLLVLRAACHLDERGAFAAAGRLVGVALKAVDAAGSDDPIVRAELLTALGQVLDHAGCELHGGRDLLTEALEILESTPGVSPLAVGRTLSRLAHALDCADLSTEALLAHDRAQLLLREAGDRKEYARAQTDHGYALWRAGRLDAAEAAFSEAIAIFAAELGEPHPQVALSRAGLAVVRQDRGDLAGAGRLLEWALTDLEQAYPRAADAHPDIAQVLDKLGYLRQLTGDLAGALTAHHRAVVALEQLFGPHDPRTAMAVTNRGLDELKAGDAAAAVRSQQRALDVFRAAYGDRHGNTVLAAGRLAEARTAADGCFSPRTSIPAQRTTETARA